MKHYIQIVFYFAVIVIMLALILVIANDYALTGIYAVFYFSFNEAVFWLMVKDYWHIQLK